MDQDGVHWTILGDGTHGVPTHQHRSFFCLSFALHLHSSFSTGMPLRPRMEWAGCEWYGMKICSTDRLEYVRKKIRAACRIPAED